MDAYRFADDVSRGLEMIMQAARASPTLGFNTAAPDTNPDAPAAEAAQEAVGEPVHGQGDKPLGHMKCPRPGSSCEECSARDVCDAADNNATKLIAENDALRTHNIGLAKQVAAKQREIDSRNHTIDVAVQSAGHAESTAQSLRNSLDAMTTERDDAISRSDNYGRQLSLACADLGAMTDERDAIEVETGSRKKYLGQTAKHWFDSSVSWREKESERSQQLADMTGERDKLKEEVGHNEHAIASHHAAGEECQEAIADLHRQLADMTAERDALKPKFDDAMGSLRNAVYYAKRDMETCRGGWSPETLRQCIEDSVELINADITKLEAM